LHLLRVRKDADRRARNHRLIQQGLLIDWAGLENWEPGQLLGGLLVMKQAADAQPEKLATWKARGDALLGDRKDSCEKGQQAGDCLIKPVLVVFLYEFCL
jgi:conjugative transfer protein TraD